MEPTKPKRIKEPTEEEIELPEFCIDDSIAQMAKEKLWWYEHVEPEPEEED